MTRKKTTAQFAETYEGCQVVANLMDLNVETIRKRAKAGKIPAKQNDRGTWVFIHAELAAAGIAPFVTVTPIFGAQAAQVLPPKKNRTHVIFVLDRSGSMMGLEGHVRNSLNAQIGELRKGSGPNDEYVISVINFNFEVTRTMCAVDTTVLSHVNPARDMYLTPGGSTALYDAVGDAISLIHSTDDGECAFLISVLTDGYENASRSTNSYSLSTTIRSLGASGRYTFTYAGPVGSSGTALGLGISPGNCTTWEQTREGFANLSNITSRSLGAYTQSRNAGVMRSESFYAQPTMDDPSKFAKQLFVKLDDVTGDVRVERVTAVDPLKISEFGRAKFGDFKPGQLYYELAESERVQDYKGIIVQDKTKGQFFSGWALAKKLLGLPDFKGTVRIRPGQLGDFKVFIQSTSVNRKLVPGTAVVCLLEA